MCLCPEQFAPDDLRVDIADRRLAPEAEVADLRSLCGHEGDRHVDRERVADDEEGDRIRDAASLELALQRGEVPACRPSLQRRLPPSMARPPEVRDDRSRSWSVQRVSECRERDGPAGKPRGRRRRVGFGSRCLRIAQAEGDEKVALIDLAPREAQQRPGCGAGGSEARGQPCRLIGEDGPLKRREVLRAFVFGERRAQSGTLVTIGC